MPDTVLGNMFWMVLGILLLPIGASLALVALLITRRTSTLAEAASALATVLRALRRNA